jgi:hypothetical protein
MSIPISQNGVTLHTSPVADSGAGLPNFGKAALDALEVGFRPIPIRPGTKIPAVKWKDGQFEMTARNIRRYWKRHPDHELAVILGHDTIVFDADTPEGVIALYMLWKTLDLSPNLIVETDRGEHHYFRLTEGAFAKSDAPNKTDHLDRVDIKTGNAIAIVPPSTGKQYLLNEITHITDLVGINQDGIDVAFRHNGREAPRKPPDTIIVGPPSTLDQEQLASNIEYLLQHIDPDCGYEDWLHVGMGICHETGGSDGGFDLYDVWSSKGQKYLGRDALYAKWRSFNGHTGTPITLGTICKLAADNGADLEKLSEEYFTPIDEDDAALIQVHGLLPYSLVGMSSDLEKEMLEHRFILKGIAILGQWTMIFAPPNSGKTLLVLCLIILGIKAGDFNGENLFYINADDNLQGLTSKLRLAEQHGFHMLSPGHKGFRVKNFLSLLNKLCSSNQARGTIIILDTYKKFTDLMDKRTAADTGVAIREYITKGGTLIALAHVNKKRGTDGKPVYAGTTDSVDDADCAFVLDIISDQGDVRTVEFENIKSRGMVVRKAAYSYSTAEQQSYAQLLETVAPVDESQADQLREATAAFDEQDFALVQVTESCIREGITAKTLLIAAVTARSGSSRRQVERVIEKFTGTDATKHHWRFTRGARGLTTYELLPDLDDICDIEDLDELDAPELPDTDTPVDFDDEEIY